MANTIISVPMPGVSDGQGGSAAAGQCRVVSTNHTGLTVSNLERTLAYFCKALGFEVTSVAPRDPAAIQAITGVAGAEVMIAYVRGIGHSFELIEYTAPVDCSSVFPRPCDTGFAHLAFDVEGIDELIDRLSQYGVLPIASPLVVGGGPNIGKKAVYLRDWDGITIELIGH